MVLTYPLPDSQWLPVRHQCVPAVLHLLSPHLLTSFLDICHVIFTFHYTSLKDKDC